MRAGTARFFRAARSRSLRRKNGFRALPSWRQPARRRGRICRHLGQTDEKRARKARPKRLIKRAACGTKTGRAERPTPGRVAKRHTQRTQNAPSYGHESSSLSPATRYLTGKGLRKPEMVLILQRFGLSSVRPFREVRQKAAARGEGSPCHGPGSFQRSDRLRYPTGP